jgi:RHS repeat-associated protein
VFAATYDAWGKRTVTNNTFAFHRGFTGHEHLPEFDLINMNGRLYDPTIGRFLSCDPYVQMPDFSQNFNRYSYCLNNPLKFTDPSGELFGIDDAIIYAVVSAAVMNGMQAGAQAEMNGKSFWSGAWKGTAIGAASAALPYGVGQVFGHSVGSLGNELLRAGAHGLGNGLLNVAEGGKFGAGFATGVAASFAGSAAQHFKFSSMGIVGSTTLAGAGAAALSGGDWMAGAMQGMSIGANNFDGKGTLEDPQRIPEVTITSHRIIDSSWQAAMHYLHGKGSPVYIGRKTTMFLLNTPEFRNAQMGITLGHYKATGSFRVDMTHEVFHIGRTPVSYTVDPNGEYVTYKLYDGDGFWDPDFIDEKFSTAPWNIPDGPGPNLERFGGTPYRYIPTIVKLPLN